jgi:hypothetical protein
MRSEPIVTGALFALLWTWASVAAAGEGELPPPPPRPEGAVDIAVGDTPKTDDEEPAPPPTFVPSAGDVSSRKHGDFRHDGFFLRFGWGPLYAIGAPENLGASRIDANVSGVGTQADIAIGGSIFDGFVLAFRVGIGALPELTFTDKDQRRSDLIDTTIMPEVGPLLLIHPMPDLGLHFFFNPSITGMDLDSTTFELDAGMFGYSLAGGIGYEAWLSEQWSVGGQLRIDGSRLSEVNRTDSGDGKMTLWSPTLQVTATYH